jgi:electron transfer flavoprotein alpha subunit
MAYLKIHRELVTDDAAGKLVQLCPFSAITYENGQLDINAACRMCKMCVSKGPKGVITLEEDEPKAGMDKSEWKGITVFVEHLDGKIHNVTFELLGKARELAGVIRQPVYALMIGSGIKEEAQVLLRYGADKVFVYDYTWLKNFILDIYANVFEDFINKVKPASILVGATNIGRSLAPRVAARFRTGLTADCTKLVMRGNTDLVQIRPAFGGNIMAQIVTTNSRPQFCTVRYKVFSAPEPSDKAAGSIEIMDIPSDRLISRVELIKLEKKPEQVDISEAEVIVAAGRGVRSEQDLDAVRELASLLGAQVACTRPLVEAGWFDPKHQIGLSGRTVGAKLIITLGISGSVQFAAGMRGSECIVAVNSDRNAPIFDIAHYCVVGDLYKILPGLIERCREVKKYGIS